jgi:hypothetical protein
MVTKLAAVDDNGLSDPKPTRAPVQRKPAKIVATFDLVGPDGQPITPMIGAKLVVKSVTRDLQAFSEAVLTNPGEVGLFAMLTVPFAEDRAA